MAENQKALTERLKAALQKMTLEYEVERYEKHAREILREEGYPADWDELSAGHRDVEAPSQRARDAEDILLRAPDARIRGKERGKKRGLERHPVDARGDARRPAEL